MPLRPPDHPPITPRLLAFILRLSLKLCVCLSMNAEVQSLPQRAITEEQSRRESLEVARSKAASGRLGTPLVFL